ncbi:MAG: DciA family protein [Pseudomonadota bacterium]
MLPPRSEPPVKTRPVRRAAPAVRRQMLTTLSALARKTGVLDPGGMEHWGESVGPELEKLCRPVRIRKQKNAETLVVSVPNGAAAMRVQYAQAQILARAKTHLGRHQLTRIAIEQTGMAATKEPRWKSRHMAPVATTSEPVVEAPAETLDEALARLAKSFGRD